MRLYIVRHGQTAWNVTKRLQGNQDIPLDDTGLRQAHTISEKLSNYDIGLIYSSPLDRAASTAKIIQHKLKKELIYCDLLKEVRLGEWECKTTPEIQKLHNELFLEWVSNPHAKIGLGVESYSELQDRAFKAIENICTLNNNSVLIVTHGTWISTLMCKFMDIPLENRTSFEINNCGISVVDYDRYNKTYNVITINDISHL